MVIWPFIPAAGYSERLSWLTSIHQSKTTEQRASLLTRPRLTLRFSFHLSDLELAHAKIMAKSVFDSGRDGSVLLPLWNELAALASVSAGATTITTDTTTSSYTATGQAVIWASSGDYEIVTISSLTDAVLTLSAPVVGDFTNCKIMPLVSAWFVQKLSLARKPSTINTVSAGFIVPVVPVIESGTLYANYLTHPVITDPAIGVGSLREVYGPTSESFDSKTGLIEQRATRDYGAQIAAMSWLVSGRSAIHALKEWLHFCRGKREAFWLPSWYADFNLVDPIASGSASIVVSENGLSGTLSDFHIMAVTRAGDQHYFSVDSIGNGVTGTEVLVLSEAAGVNIAVVDIYKICFLTMSRFNSDQIEIKHNPPNLARIVVPVVECPLP